MKKPKRKSRILAQVLLGLCKACFLKNIKHLLNLVPMWNGFTFFFHYQQYKQLALRFNFNHHIRQLAGANTRFSRYKFDLRHLDLVNLKSTLTSTPTSSWSFTPKQLTYININFLYETWFFYSKDQNLLSTFDLLSNDAVLPFLRFTYGRAFSNTNVIELQFFGKY